MKSGQPQGLSLRSHKIQIYIKHFAPSPDNICDRRLRRIEGASVGAAVDFVRRSKPHKQKSGYRKRTIAVERSETKGVKKVVPNYKKLPQSFFCKKMTAPSKMGRKHELNIDIKCGQEQAPALPLLIIKSAKAQRNVPCVYIDKRHSLCYNDFIKRKDGSYAEIISCNRL